VKYRKVADVVSRIALLFMPLWPPLTYSVEPDDRSAASAVADFLCSNFQFFSEYHFDAEVKNFYFYKSIYYKEHYFLETTLDVDFVILSFRDRVLLEWDFMFINEMGQTPGDIVFDPIDVGYGLTPFFEFRFSACNVHLGLAHHCYHQIDRQALPTVYFNNPIFAIGSKNRRLQDYCENLTRKKTWTFNDRFSWYCRSGYYMRDFFGLVEEEKLNGINPYIVDGSGEYRYCFYGIGSWFFTARGSTMVGYYTDVPGNHVGKGIGWKQDVFLEANFRRGDRGGLLFSGTSFDGLPSYPSMGSDARVPRFSYDRLLQIGLKFFL
jgi:hypothetical protein